MPTPERQLIPPQEGPPSSLQAPDPPFNWLRGIIGAIVGIGVAVLAYALEWSSWWWLAVPMGLALGVPLRFAPNVLWGHK